MVIGEAYLNGTVNHLQSPEDGASISSSGSISMQTLPYLSSIVVVPLVDSELSVIDPIMNKVG